MIIRFFDIDLSEMEEKGWWVLMMGFLWKNPWHHLIEKLFRGSRAVCATLLRPQIIKWPNAHHTTTIDTPPLGELPTARCAARLCVGMVVIIGHFYLLSIIMVTADRGCAVHYILLFWDCFDQKMKLKQKWEEEGNKKETRKDALQWIFYHLCCKYLVSEKVPWNS